MIDALSEGYVGDGPCRYQVVLNGASDAAMTATKTETKGGCWVIEERTKLLLVGKSQRSQIIKNNEYFLWR